MYISGGKLPTTEKAYLGFTNYPDHKSSNVYNAKTTDATIQINTNTGNFNQDTKLVGLASVYSHASVINSYNSHKGLIIIAAGEESSNQFRDDIIGLASLGNAYNSYNGNGEIRIIQQTNTSDYIGEVTGIAEWIFPNTSDGKFTDKSPWYEGYLYNAFSGTGLIHLEGYGIMLYENGYTFEGYYRNY